MGNKLIAGLAVLVLSSIFFPAIVSAHTLATDGQMGAILHIDPEDYPVINQPQGLIFYYSDSSGTFRTQNCICVLTIKEGNTQLLQIAAPATTPTSSKYTYTFKKPDVYSITLSGKPKNGSFPPFNLVFNTRVDTSVPGETSGSYAPSNLPSSTYHKKVGAYFGALVAAAALLILTSGYLFYGSHKSKPKGKK